FRNEKRTGHFRCGEPAEKTQCQGYLRGGPEGGWQQVKISRSLSSATAVSSSGSAATSISADCWCRKSRDSSLRSRSIARLRAVVMIHPAGLGGGPEDGHRCTAS